MEEGLLRVRGGEASSGGCVAGVEHLALSTEREVEECLVLFVHLLSHDSTYWGRAGQGRQAGWLAGCEACMPPLVLFLPYRLEYV